MTKDTFIKTGGGTMLKKKILAGVLFFLCVFAANADDLADILQDLAVQTACLGMYSATEAEPSVLVASRYDDPPDWYNPPMMANRFAAMSGNMTRITTFYGVCFDYAQFAWDDIKKYQKSYNEAGMKGQQWYIAAANAGDPNTIILYDPVSKEKATTISNGVYLKEKEHHKVSAHDGASGHAWLWVQHNNGTWYWIDPTWTDNTGYVWWGIVENGKEVTYYPDADYCIATNYPRPPRPDEPPAEKATRSPNSTYTESPDSSVDLAHLGYSVGYIRAFDYRDPSANGDYNIFDNAGLSFSIEDRFPGAFSLFCLSFDFLSSSEHITVDDGTAIGIASFTVNSFIFGIALGYPIYSIFTLYAGGGLGFTNREYGGYNGTGGWDLPDDTDDKTSEFAWKINAGLRIQFAIFFAKVDVSYGTILGPSFGLGAGIFL
jgi:opacity protein-like surface antigen